jgi:hypothetical protein
MTANDAIQAQRYPALALDNIRYEVRDIKRRMKAGEASDTDIFCTLNRISSLAGEVP